MAQRVVVTVLDDVDGSEAAENLKFSLDGVAYEIDLSSKNAARLRKALGPWVTAARKDKGATAAGKRGSRAIKAAGGPATSEIREWAKAHGYTDLKTRGRVPAEIRKAYEKATN
ncbi:Lsr2 family protein [Streptomyces sp. NPDC087850]|uniref:histone-like nucleoid-structuring protein Lsr2 n=1 Tax=Streptomyces sp. NPDC087850 TaxID=3365809 RepID=UPI0037F5EB68